MCTSASESCNEPGTPVGERRLYFKVWERRRYGPPAYADVRPWVLVGYECYAPARVPRDAVGARVVRVLGWVDVYNAVREVAAARKEVVVQPPHGRTLVNLATNVYTSNDGWSVPGLTFAGFPGVKVDVRGVPVGRGAYRWDFGDGTVLVTDTSGRAYPDMEVTHKYVEAHVTVGINVTTTYAVEFRVNGSAVWQPIPEPVVATGPTAEVEVVESKPRLVGSDCDPDHETC